MKRKVEMSQSAVIRHTNNENVNNVIVLENILILYH